ncbi:uncharacterized protein DNG_07011 [Cephalotrichum gorgonifer]|uniref:Uncharacterized protein n=1 Tax=Cephalotrichum gorgonifer TaxID=2041049 RepID=A0AAE8N1P8_9PEZI|nr:uncharacterized protein DNG_07011 [Cephalotrichum gorgonifer]
MALEAIWAAGMWARANPGAAAGVALMGGGAFAAAAPLAVALPALGVLGFGSTIAQGTIATTIQSGIGNVVGQSIFAILQSAGAGGYGVAVVGSAVQVAGTGVAAAGATLLARATRGGASGI